jgi:hypothetical protein
MAEVEDMNVVRIVEHIRQKVRRPVSMGPISSFLP